MPFFFRKRQQPSTVTFLECVGYSGSIYRVVGRGTPDNMQYSIEVVKSAGGAQRAVLPDASLEQANALALQLLDTNASPADLKRLALATSLGTDDT